MVIPGQTPVTVTYTLGNPGARARCRGTDSQQFRGSRPLPLIGIWRFRGTRPLLRYQLPAISGRTPVAANSPSFELLPAIPGRTPVAADSVLSNTGALARGRRSDIRQFQPIVSCHSSVRCPTIPGRRLLSIFFIRPGLPERMSTVVVRFNSGNFGGGVPLPFPQLYRLSRFLRSSGDCPARVRRFRHRSDVSGSVPAYLLYHRFHQSLCYRRVQYSMFFAVTQSSVPVSSGSSVFFVLVTQ